jgi:hypothetical protein
MGNKTIKVISILGAITMVFSLSSCSAGSDESNDIYKKAVTEAWNVFDTKYQLMGCSNRGLGWNMILLALTQDMGISVTPVDEPKYKSAAETILEENC